jgi:hypothetical protein
MTNYSYRVVTTRRREFVVSPPAYASDFEDALRHIKTMGEVDVRFGDAIHMECRDDEIVLWYDLDDSVDTRPETGSVAYLGKQDDLIARQGRSGPLPPVGDACDGNCHSTEADPFPHRGDEGDVTAATYEEEMDRRQNRGVCDRRSQ